MKFNDHHHINVYSKTTKVNFWSESTSIMPEKSLPSNFVHNHPSSECTMDLCIENKLNYISHNVFLKFKYMTPNLFAIFESLFDSNNISDNEKIYVFAYYFCANHNTILSSLRRRIGDVHLNFWST